MKREGHNRTLLSDRTPALITMVRDLPSTQPPLLTTGRGARSQMYLKFLEA
jgi:hypothetical protein